VTMSVRVIVRSFARFFCSLWSVSVWDFGTLRLLTYSLCGRRTVALSHFGLRSPDCGGEVMWWKLLSCSGEARKQWRRMNGVSRRPGQRDECMR